MSTNDTIQCTKNISSSSMFVVYTHPKQLQDPERQLQVRSSTAKLTRRHSRRVGGSVLTRQLASNPNAVRCRQTSEESGSSSKRNQVSNQSQPAEGAVRTCSAEEDPLLVVLDPVATHIPWRFPIKIDAALGNAIKFYFDVFMPANATVFNYSGRNAVRQVWPWAQQSPLSFAALLNMSLAMAVKRRPATDDLHQAFIYHRSNVLRLLRSRLASGGPASIDDVAIYAVGTLMVVDAITGHPDGIEAHRRGLREMVRLRGGLDQLGLDGVLRRMVMMTEGTVNFSKVTERPNLGSSPPQFKCTLQQPITYPVPGRDDLLVECAPPGLRSLTKSGKFSHQIIAFLNVSLPLLMGSANQYSALQSEFSAKAFELLAIENLSITEKCLVRCLQVYFGASYTKRHYFVPNRNMEALAWALVDLADWKRVMEKENTLTNENKNILVWMMVVVASMPDRSLLPFSQRKDLFDQARKLSDAAESWGPLEATLKEFLWNDTFAVSGKAYWSLTRDDEGFFEE